MKKGEKNVSRVQVFARCRPIVSIERPVVEAFPKEKKVLVKDRNKEFTFDKVFVPDVKQIDVYKSVAEPLIQEVLKGFNCTILAYGQTGTGKTYTMEGRRSNTLCSWEDDPDAGLIPRSLHQLFEELNKGDNVEFSVRVSFLELYNEELFDLLSAKDDLTKLRIFDIASKKGSVHITGLSEVNVRNKDEVYAILEKGTARRQTAATNLNISSSRSHAVFSVTVYIKENTTDGEELVKTGKLNLVDLAGSECVGRSGCVNQRLREASNINMSLLTLGRVITALIENQPHVPYRESKLTRLLQDSLGGHTKTSFIATISPELCNLEETMSTLEYATKAKNITNKPIVNEKMTKRALIRELTEEIERLRRDLDAQRTSEGIFVNAENYISMEKKMADIKLLEEQLSASKQYIQEIEQSLTLTKEKLQEKTEQHKETVSKLTEVSGILCNTEKLLSRTALERDEKDYLLNIHRNKEKQLVEQNQELNNAVCEVTENVDKLHMKVERKQKVEMTNEERCKQFKQACHKQFAHLDEMANDLTDVQENKLENIQQKLADACFEFFTYCQQSNNILNKIEFELNNSLNNFSSSLSNEFIENEKMSNLLLENMDSEKNALVRDQEVFCSENIPAFKEKSSTMIAETNNLILYNQHLVLQKVDTFQNQIKVQSEERGKRMEILMSSIHAFKDHHSSLVNSLGERVQIQSSQDSDTLEEISKLKINFRNNYIMHITELDQLFENVSARKENTPLIKGIHQNMEKSIPDLTAMDKLSQKQFETDKEECQVNLVSFDEISSSVKTNELTSQLDSFASFQNSETSDIASFIKNNQQKQESAIEKIKEKVKGNEVVKRNNYELKKSSLKEIQDSLRENVKESISNLDCEKNKVLETVSVPKTIVEESKKELRNASQQLKKEILQRDLEFEKFISEDLQKDLPTGTTPQRKPYYYEKKLIQLSPDEEKLRILRRIRGEQTDKSMNLDLPMDSSFDDSDEFKSPLNLGFSELTVENAESIHNASFNNGDEYLTDCETLSNASSTSDLSVTGLKNKENMLNFKKPTLNIPKVKRVRKKVESSIPTPTQKKPLSLKNASAFT